MKNKKLNIIFTLLIAVFSAVLFSACGEIKGSLSFKQQGITMAINQEISLEQYVELIDCKFSDITFVSSNPEVVYVKPSGKLVSRGEGVSLISATGYSDAIFEVTVSGTTIKFATPTNLRYDESNGMVVWDAIYAGDIVATTYEITITQNGGQPETIVTNKNYYKILNAGDFDVQVKCIGREGIIESDLTEVYSFSKLSAPTNLLYNDTNKLLTWESDAASHGYRVIVNGVGSELINGTQFMLDLSEPKEYNISVMSCPASGEENVFGAISLNNLTLTRLSAPELSVERGILAWNDESLSAESYKVYVDGTIAETIQKNSSGSYSYNLQGRGAGEYDVEIVAMGDSAGNTYTTNEHFLNSEKTSIENIVKLPSLRLGFEKNNKKIVVGDFDETRGYKIILEVSYNGGQFEEIDISENGEKIFEFNKAGRYVFKLKNASGSNLEINSEYSEELSVIKLAEARDAQHKIYEDKYIVENYQIEGATEYYIYLVKGDESVALTENNNSVSGGLFNEAGTYGVQITAINNTISSNTYYLESVTNTNLQVIRLGDVEPADNQKGVISWSAVYNPGNLKYQYKLTGAESREGDTDAQNLFNYTALPVGDYNLEVWATCNGIGSTIVLDSLNTGKIDFSVYKKLQTPALDWSKQVEQGATKYFINITPVDGAEKYKISCNGSPVGAIEGVQGANISFDATECFEAEGKGDAKDEYYFTVEAVNENNRFYSSSEVAELKVKRASTPTEFNLEIPNENAETLTENIASTSTSKWYADTEIKINGTLTNCLQEVGTANEYVVSVKYITNTQKVDGFYYIDSNVSTFTLERMQAVFEVESKNLTYEGTETAQQITKRLIVSQEATTKIIDVSSLEKYDLTNLGTIGFDLNEAITVSVQYVAKSFKGTISEDTKYYVSSPMATLNVMYANAEIDLTVNEVVGKVNISWNKKTGFEYKLNNSDKTQFNSEDFTTNEKMFGLQESNNQTTNVYLFTITRVVSVSELSVDKDENITTKLPNGAKQLVCNDGTSEITTLKNVGTTGVKIKAYFVANESTTHEFLLNGNETTFEFKRLEKLSGVLISGNIITWNKDEADLTNKYNYIINFCDDENPNGAVDPIKIALADSVSMNLTKDYSHIIYALTGERKIKIEKIVDEFTAKSGQINYLSSEEFKTSLKILSKPTNVSISATGDLQDTITISWNMETPTGYGVKGYKIKVVGPGFEDKSEIDGATPQYIVPAGDNRFKSAGEWVVEVQAIGLGETISSEFSEATKITRLNPSSAISVTLNGEIKWNEVDNAIGYKLIYSYIKNGESVTVNKEFDVAGLSYQMEPDELKQEFSGEIDVKLYAIGDGGSKPAGQMGYLSSIATQQFIRLEKPQITLTNTGIIFENFENYKDDEIFHLIAKIKNKSGNFVTSIDKQIEIKLNAQNGKYMWLYPHINGESYQWENGGKYEIVTFEIARDITFEVYVESKNSNRIISNAANNEATILENIKNIGFKRDANGTINFVATNSNTGICNTKLNFGDVEMGIKDSNISKELTEEILNALPNDWSISITPEGGIVEQGGADKVFINGTTTRITGKKLSNKSTISVDESHRKVEWTKIDGALKYRLNVYNASAGIEPTATKDIDGREEIIGTTYAGGTYEFAVKALGNISTTILYADGKNQIILDGTFSKRKQVIKLDAIQNLSVNLGYFTFDEVAHAEKYVVEISQTALASGEATYELNKVDWPIEGAPAFYSNDDLITKLRKDNKTYYAKFYVATSEADYIYSDYATIKGTGYSQDYIKIKLFDAEDNKITLWHPTLSKEITDYSITKATFNLNNQVNNGVLYTHNGKTVYLSNGEITLDDNRDEPWTSGKHEISYAQLGSSGINANGEAFLTSFGDKTPVTKLGMVEIYSDYKPFGNGGKAQAYENALYHGSTEGATLYYCYFDNALYAKLSEANIQIDLASLAAGEYQSMGVRAINTTDITVLAGEMAYFIDEAGNNQKIRKLPAPEEFDVKNGALNFEIGLLGAYQIYMANETLTSPVYTSKNLLEQNQQILMTFTNTQTGANYLYYDSLYNYLACEGIGNYAPDIDLKQGFPKLEYTFLDFASTLPGGEYEIKAKLMGHMTEGDVENTTILFTSEFGEAITKYISNAPEIRIENNNDIYNLKFTNVTVNENYFNNAQKPIYNLVGIYADDNGKPAREIITTIEPIGVNNSQTLELNLSELIENGKLTSKYDGIFVYIAGNDQNGVLNGICSNIINIKALEAINAWAHHGEIVWKGQEFATKYVIVYGENKKLEITAKQDVQDYIWDCKELESGKTYENVTIMAYGSQGSSDDFDTLYISGKITNIGNICKLETISLDENGIAVNSGVYNWRQIANASGYDVFTLKEATTGNYGNYLSLTTNYYETMVGNNDIHYYYFRAFGDTKDALGEGITTYVNSNISEFNKGQRVNAITNLKMKDGILTWERGDSNADWYKLIFTQTDKDSVVINAEHNVIAKNGICILDTNDYESLMQSGEYIVTIQAYYKEKTKTNADSIWLISSKQTLEFYKLKTVSEIRVTNGVISWNYQDESKPENYYFKLVFTYFDNAEGKDITQIKYVNKNVNMYEGVVFNKDISDSPITLVIYVVPGLCPEEGQNLSGDNSPYALSVPYTYENKIYQFNKVNENSIKVSITENGQLKIDWEDVVTNVAGGNNAYKYEISYYTSEDPSIIKTTTTFESQIICGEGNEISFDIKGEYSLYFQIRVIPTIDNYISSAKTTQKEIKRPKSVDNFMFDTQGYFYKWDKYDAQEEGSFSYKIKDELGTIDEETGEFIATSIRIYYAELEDTKFIPSEISVHRVSVAVVIRNAEDGSGLVSEYCDSIIKEIDLFASGKGTDDNPFIISSEDHFNNIQYRLTKDSKNNTYFNCTIDANGKEIVDNNASTEGAKNQFYNFKQEGHLAVKTEQTLSVKLDDNGNKQNTDYVFNGNYDGDFYSLTLDLSETQIVKDDSNCEHISLFDEVGQNGGLQNINVGLNIGDFTTSKEISISALSYKNSGTINNIIVGKTLDKNQTEQKTISIQDLKNSLTLSFVAYENYGEISNVQNLYNVDLSSQDNLTNITITYAAIVYNNSKTISQVKNSGSIDVKANTVYVGGLVAVMNERGAIIEQSANVANIKIFLREATESYVGGLVASMAYTQIKNCYSVGDLTVATSVTNASGLCMAGGIAGMVVEDNIKLVYVNVTKNQNLSNESQEYSEICQLAGKITSARGYAKSVFSNGGLPHFAPYEYDGGSLEGFETYTDNPMSASGLFDDGSEFEFAAGQDNPKLTWEEKFDSNNPWKQIEE